jgi:hypothetical protein
MIEHTNTLPRPNVARATVRVVVILVALAIVCAIGIYGFFDSHVQSGHGLHFIALLVACAALLAGVACAIEAPWRSISTEQLEQLRDAAESDAVIADVLSAWTSSGPALRRADCSAAMNLYWRRERARCERASRDDESRRRSVIMTKLREGRTRW